VSRKDVVIGYSEDEKEGRERIALRNSMLVSTPET